jgi:hypothetical protein
MRSYIGSVVVALTVVGCATEELDTSAATQAMKGCPDPRDCTDNNGGGVYTEELGFAGFGPNQFMITTFINVTNPNGDPIAVNVVGRKFDASQGIWLVTTAMLDHALIGNDVHHPYNVIAVGEWLTSPTFTLSDGTLPNKTVSASALTTMQLVVLDDKLPYTLSFGAEQSDVGSTGGTGSTGALVWSYPMFWNAGTTATANPTIYCEHALLHGQVTPAADAVVFQQGIAVDPINAEMTRNGADVTMSCRYGAIANARSWGYIYRQGTDPSLMFEAAMHMKRASYCGDRTFYTHHDTKILVNDTAQPPIQADGVNSSNVEARWGRAPGGRIRALCVNYHVTPSDPPDLRRHWSTRYPVTSGALFNGDCFDLNHNYEFTIPTCWDFDAANGSGAVISNAADPAGP